jgi:hypothetical protein
LGFVFETPVAIISFRGRITLGKRKENPPPINTFE